MILAPRLESAVFPPFAAGATFAVGLALEGLAAVNGLAEELKFASGSLTTDFGFIVLF